MRRGVTKKRMVVVCDGVGTVKAVVSEFWTPGGKIDGDL